MKNRDMPAMALSEYQLTEAVTVKGCPPEIKEIKYVKAHGLTKREHFAGLAMQALLSATSNGEWSGINAGAAEQAVKEADALLEALEKDNE